MSDWARIAQEVNGPFVDCDERVDDALSEVAMHVLSLRKVGTDLIARAFNEGLDEALIVVERLRS